MINFQNIIIPKIVATKIPIIPARDVLPNNNHIERRDAFLKLFYA